MIATVTLNPAIDKSVTVRGFEIGKTNRGEVARVDAGGKGINVAKGQVGRCRGVMRGIQRGTARQ